MLKTYHDNLNSLSLGLCNTNLNHLLKLYRAIVSKETKHHGRKYMVKHMKDLNTICERYAIHQPIEPLNFCKSDSNGFPNKIRLFKSYLRNENSIIVICTLSILRSCEIFRIPPSHDLSTVEDPPTYDEKVVEDIILYIPKFINRLSKPEYPEMEYHYTVKNGPNGPALDTSDIDLSTLKQDADLYNAYCVVETELCKDGTSVENFQDTNLGIHSRITQFSEKAGKTRTIGIVDYYSQRALKPLHTVLMTILRSLSSDGTFEHNSVGNYAQNATKEKSFIETGDMTAFTDRFPAIIQLKLLHCLESNQTLADAWWTLLSKRRFVCAWDGRDVKYSTGQPMGAYASWPLCTLAHHLIIHYSHYKCSIKDVWNNYRILGDDNEITNKVISNHYKETIRSLGMELNPYKGTCSESGAKYSGAEVAKRLYLNGKNISPLTPGIIKDLSNPNMLNSTLAEMMNRFDIEALPVHVLENIVAKQQRKRAWMLVTNPFNGSIKPLEGYDESQQWSDICPDEADEVHRKMRIISLVKQANKFNESENFLIQWSLLQGPPSEFTKPIGGNMKFKTVPPEAVMLSRKHILKLLFKALARLRAPYQFITDQVLEEVEYLPDPSNPFKDMKDVRSTQTSLLVEKSFDFLKAGEDVYDLEWKIPPTLNIS